MNAFRSNNVNYINDVSSGTYDNSMFDAVSSLGCKFILTHMPSEHKQGTIKEYENILDEMKIYFSERIDTCVKAGIDNDKIIIDPGIGFGKSGADNIKLLTNINQLQNIHPHVCIGSSNKRFSSKLFDKVKTKRIWKLQILQALQLLHYRMLATRVHDVELTKDTIMIIDKAKSLM